MSSIVSLLPCLAPRAVTNIDILYAVSPPINASQQSTTNSPHSSPDPLIEPSAAPASQTTSSPSQFCVNQKDGCPNKRHAKNPNGTLKKLERVPSYGYCCRLRWHSQQQR
ncbi:hypothetical protein F4804DRAFT_320081 [Jackrogersella minutella]|nr:hypothetical protein F4804DRAFT_320081 [Jackrogersella minutella]